MKRRNLLAFLVPFSFLALACSGDDSDRPAVNDASADSAAEAAADATTSDSTTPGTDAGRDSAAEATTDAAPDSATPGVDATPDSTTPGVDATPDSTTPGLDAAPDVRQDAAPDVVVVLDAQPDQNVTPDVAQPDAQTGDAGDASDDGEVDGSDAAGDQ